MINLLPGEEVVLVKRHYWLPIVAELFVFLVIALIPWGIFMGEQFTPPTVRGWIDANTARFFFLSCGWLLAIWILSFIAWTNYYLDTFIVTTKRIIDVDQVGLFARTIAEAPLENIQDVRVEISGILASLINYGDIHIQSAGATKEFAAHSIPKPQEVKDTVFRLRHTNRIQGEAAQ